FVLGFCLLGRLATRLLEVAHTGRVALVVRLDREADPGRSLGVRVHESHVGDVDRRFHGLDATGLRPTLGLSYTGVLGDEVDTFDDDAVLALLDADDPALLAAVTATLGSRAADDL